MVTHASADSDMSIAYFSQTINEKKEIIKAEKTIREIVKSQLMEWYVIQNIVMLAMAMCMSNALCL